MLRRREGEGTLKDVDIISGVLHNKFGYQEDEIKVLTEAEATKANFIIAVEDMIASGSKPTSYTLSVMDIQLKT